MRWSQALIPTQKETPADAVAPSHILLLRAGMIRPLGAGAYTYMPLGLRVLNKAINIVRQEMDAAGAIELHMPALQPIELWQESGRDQTMAGILMKFTLGERHHVTLGPTHEEVITDLARDLVNSYKQLPLTLYQIQTKFRNEPRPRFGILRTREFLMKDAYSFDANLEQLNSSYTAMYEAYCRIFDRCGLPYVAVEAESGPIGGDASHEFMVPCDTGEDSVIRCPACGYAANREKAEIGRPTGTSQAEPSTTPYEAVSTPGRRTIEEVSSFLKVTADQTAKLLVFRGRGRFFSVLLRGDHEVNEAKVKRTLDSLGDSLWQRKSRQNIKLPTIGGPPNDPNQTAEIELASPDEIESITGSPMGFVGPVGIIDQIVMLIDRDIANMSTCVVGGNATDLHYRGVVPGRDFPLENLYDLRNAGTGDPCPRCGEPLVESQGIEIGHVFKLGTKYSQAMNATFLDEKGQAHPIIMGCYGIGVNRILAAAVEACNDANGIIWPLSLAPYQVAVVPLQVNNQAVVEAADRITAELEKAGVDVLIDDRDQRPGAKFKDVDLIGIPLRVVVGERGLKEGKVELKWRDQSEAATVDLETAAQGILEVIETRRQSEASAQQDRQVARALARGIHIA